MVIRGISGPARQGLTILRYDAYGYPVHLVLGGLTPTQNLKYYFAVGLMDDLEELHGASLRERVILVSSSGNLALSLAHLCRERRCRLAAVIDPLILPSTRSTLRFLGVELIEVTEADAAGGYLATRRARAASLAGDPRYCYIDQYATASNSRSYYRLLAPQVFAAVPGASHLFVPAGTCGTLMGLARYAREHCSGLTVVAVDIRGSVIFGGPPGRRRIPGMGSSIVPPLLDMSLVDDVVATDEALSVARCRSLAAETGFLFGGSTGSTMAAVQSYFEEKGTRPEAVIALSVDFGDRYAERFMEWNDDDGRP